MVDRVLRQIDGALYVRLAHDLLQEHVLDVPAQHSVELEPAANSCGIAARTLGVRRSRVALGWSRPAFRRLALVVREGLALPATLRADLRGLAFDNVRHETLFKSTRPADLLRTPKIFERLPVAPYGRMALVLSENSRPEDFNGHADAMLSPFFKSLARENGQDCEGPIMATKDMIKRKFLRSRIGQMFQLTTTQFDEVVTTSGGDVAWRPAIEGMCGFEFKRPAPSSADQLMSGVVSVDQHEGVGEGAAIITSENTLCKELGKSKYTRIRIPDVIMNMLNCVDPRTEKVKLSPLVNEVATWFFCWSGKTNIGANLIRQMADQIEAVYVMHKNELYKKLKLRLSLLGRKDAKVNHCSILAALSQTTVATMPYVVLSPA